MLLSFIIYFVCVNKNKNSKNKAFFVIIQDRKYTYIGRNTRANDFFYNFNITLVLHITNKVRLIMKASEISADC